MPVMGVQQGPVDIARVFKPLSVLTGLGPGGNNQNRSVPGRHGLNWECVGGIGMGRMSSSEYQDLLDKAGNEAEAEAAESVDTEALEMRLNALQAGGFEIGEAEQAAAAAEVPDQTVVGIQRPLTKAQIEFAQGVIEGKSRRQAYRDAYPNAKGTDPTISACAHKLSKDPRIQRMIAAGWEETTEALAEDLAAQRRYVSRALVALSKGGKQEGTRLKALELLGRAAGMFRDIAPTADKPITADDLRRELAGHLRLVGTIAKRGA